MRGGHCFKVWIKKQQVESLFTAEGELYAAVNTASEESSQQRAEGSLIVVSWLLATAPQVTRTVKLVSEMSRSEFDMCQTHGSLSVS